MELYISIITHIMIRGCTVSAHPLKIQYFFFKKRMLNYTLFFFSVCMLLACNCLKKLGFSSPVCYKAKLFDLFMADGCFLCHLTTFTTHFNVAASFMSAGALSLLSTAQVVCGHNISSSITMQTNIWFMSVHIKLNWAHYIN